jgi:hypothetical protein
VRRIRNAAELEAPKPAITAPDEMMIRADDDRCPTSKFHFLEIRLFSNEALYVHICKSSRLAMGMVNNKPGRSPRFNYCSGGGGGSGQNLLYGDWSGGRWAQWLPYS